MMSKIYEEFMENYNKLAEINDKPLIKQAEELPMVDPEEGMPESALEVDDYTDYDVVDPGEKQLKIQIKAVIEKVKDAVVTLYGASVDNDITKEVATELNSAIYKLRKMIGEDAGEGW